MTTQEVKRKLTAILSADVKGYSRLMGEDEERTLRTLNAYKETMRSLIQQHRGRIVNAPGDNVLAEFASVVDAVQCGVEIQQVLRAKNAVLPENHRMEFRIGESGMFWREVFRGQGTAFELRRNWSMLSPAIACGGFRS